MDMKGMVQNLYWQSQVLLEVDRYKIESTLLKFVLAALYYMPSR